jgi:hypothetical protein
MGGAIPPLCIHTFGIFQLHQKGGAIDDTASGRSLSPESATLRGYRTPVCSHRGASDASCKWAVLVWTQRRCAPRAGSRHRYSTLAAFVCLLQVVLFIVATSVVVTLCTQRTVVVVPCWLKAVRAAICTVKLCSCSSALLM